jgi:DMSO/TMAO reductase YedYZ molybdopterin-dependent catalytic subunit
MATVMRAKPYRVIAGIGAGAGAALAMMAVMALLHFALGMPTIPELMINPIVKFMGGQAFSDALDKLYYAGRPLLFTSILEGTLLLGVLLGLLYAWLARPKPSTGSAISLLNGMWGGVLYGLVIGVLLDTVFLAILGQPVFADRPYGIYAASPIPLWAGLMLQALVFGVTLRWLLPRAQTPAAVPGEGVSPFAPAPLVVQRGMDRRSFAKIAGGTLLALLAGVGFVLEGARLNQGNIQISPNSAGGDNTNTADTPTPEPIPTDTPVPTPSTPGSAAQGGGSPTAESAPPTEPLSPSDTATPANVIPVIKVSEITPNDSFYHVSKNFFDPSPSADGWKLEFKGLVDKPYSLTYAQLTALPATKVTTGMMCISNPIGGGLIGNTTWKGVHFADLIKKASPKQGVVDVLMRAVDDYSDSIPIQKALDPDVMLVWEMGGQPLTSEHGFPARLLVPGIYGMKHVKWITSVELVNYDYKGFWQDPSQGWSDPAPVNTMSRIDFPTEGNLDLKPQDLSGVAFAGDRSISKVEISTDGGKTWDQAYIKPRLSQTSWVVWGYRWTPPKPGSYTVQVRATDGLGNLQTSQIADPYPNGATGYHTVTYSVSG